MYDIISFILIVASLSVIVAIVVRKFSALANLDVDNIKFEREAKFKEQIISNRIKRNYKMYLSRFSRAFSPVMKSVGDFFKKLYGKLVDIKEEEVKSSGMKAAESEEKSLDQMFLEANELIMKEDFASAEKKYIDIIALDSKNVLAFKKLAKLYADRKDYAEAKQTLEHALRLTENISSFSESSDNEDYSDVNISGMYFELALICKADDLLDEALENIDKALNFESNNPRYLDTKFDICIINKDKDAAVQVFEKLKEVNPENRKLEEMQNELAKL